MAQIGSFLVRFSKPLIFEIAQKVNGCQNRLKNDPKIGQKVKGTALDAQKPTKKVTFSALPAEKSKTASKTRPKIERKSDQNDHFSPRSDEKSVSRDEEPRGIKSSKTSILNYLAAAPFGTKGPSRGGPNWLPVGKIYDLADLDPYGREKD